MISLAVINEFLGQPPNASEHGFQIDHILEFSHWFMGILFLGWSAYFVYVLLRFRKGISTHLEFSVVLIEAVLFVGFAVPLWAKRVNEFPETGDAVLVHAIGQQFNWNFHLPGPDGQFGRRDINLVTNSNPLGLDPNDPASKDDIVVLGELHIPLNRPVIVEISSKDVIHNFALPHMRIAQDAIPGSVIPMWFKPIKAGAYEIVCGQLCGLGHSGMKGMLVVDAPEDYQAWLKERVELSGTQSAPAPAQRPPGEPGAGPTPGTIAPPGAPKTANPSGNPDGQAAPSPTPGG
jgi:cytochrome c oxidase subunit 2